MAAQIAITKRRTWGTEDKDGLITGHRVIQVYYHEKIRITTFETGVPWTFARLLYGLKLYT